MCSRILALYAAFLSDPSGTFEFTLEPGPGDKPRIEKIKIAFREEQLSFFHRLRARVRKIALGNPDSAALPAIGLFHCRECRTTYEFDRRGALRAALAARGEPYTATEPEAVCATHSTSQLGRSPRISPTTPTSWPSSGSALCTS